MFGFLKKLFGIGTEEPKQLPEASAVVETKPEVVVQEAPKVAEPEVVKVKAAPPQFPFPVERPAEGADVGRSKAAEPKLDKAKPATKKQPAKKTATKRTTKKKQG